jgi:AcrR family transcriptional regulator
MNKRELAKAETRALLLETARALFVERGVDETTTREVARRAGVGVGTVFAHFPDKASLVEAVLVDHIDRALDVAFATLPEGDVVDQLVHVAAQLYRTYAEHPSISRSLLAGALFVSGSERPMALQLGRFRDWVVARLAAERGAATTEDFFVFFALYFMILVAGLRGEIPAEDQPRVLDRLVRRSFGGVG